MKIHIIHILICIVMVFSSCSTFKNQYGETIIKNTFDSSLSKNEIMNIKSLNNSIFDSLNYIGKKSISINYRLFSPSSNIHSKDKFPLVIIFHGSGNIGTDNKSQLGLLPKLFAKENIQRKYTAYVLAPQFQTRSSDYKMDSNRNVLYSSPRACLGTLFELVDSLMLHLNIDHKRIYVIGYSMGGSTVINSLIARPDLFAAGISISGIPQFDKIESIKMTPIWLIHGTDDMENPILSDEQFYKERGSRTRFWKLNGLNHNNIFNSIVFGETLPKWLFKQKKK